MKKLLLLLLVVIAIPVSADEGIKQTSGSSDNVIKCAVIGGMSMTTGLWEEISRMFEADTGYKVEVVSAGPRPGLSKSMRNGEVDLLTMHSGDITTDLVADGFGVNMRPWTRNDLVIVGPASDPARIAGMTDGAEALKKIAKARANFVDIQDIGIREMSHTLWKRAGIHPQGKWYLKDESGGHLDFIGFAARHNTYLLFGRMPITMGKVLSHNMKILVDRDPTMRRPYIVMEANPLVFPKANIKGARALSNYLFSEKIQKFIADYGKDKNGGFPFFYPISPMAVKYASQNQ